MNNTTIHTVELEKKDLKVYYLPEVQEWWAARSAEEAIGLYNNNETSEDFYVDNASECSVKELNALTFYDEKSIPHRTITFMQLLSETTEPGFFAIEYFLGE